MSVDHTKVVYYSGYTAYKNVNVYSATIPVTSVAIGPSTAHFFETTVTVEPNTKFAYIKVQANDFDFINPPSALEWRQYPGNTVVYGTLSTNPFGDPGFELTHNVRIVGDEVTFRLFAFNPYPSDIAFNAMSVDVEYATFTIE